MQYPISNEKIQVFAKAYALAMEDRIGEKLKTYVDLQPDSILAALEDKIRDAIRHKSPWKEVRLFLGDLTQLVYDYNYHDVKTALDDQMAMLLWDYFPAATYEFAAHTNQIHLIFTLPEVSGQTSNQSR